MGDNEKAVITTQYCLECERIARLNDLRSAMQKAREIGAENMANAHWEAIQHYQRHQWQHTCRGAGHE